MEIIRPEEEIEIISGSSAVKEKTAALAGLLQKYDRLCEGLETKGGRIAVVEKIRALMAEKIGICGMEVSLTEQKKLRIAVRRAGAVIDVRKNPAGGLPAYYIFRVSKENFFSSKKGIIVEDIYMSRRRYPLENNARFARVAGADGREVFLCRLSQYRKRVKNLAGASVKNADAAADSVLKSAGLVLRAAWHEDHRPAIEIEKHGAIRVPSFMPALELIYLTLCSEPFLLKQAVSEETVLFFSKIYEKKHIHRYLQNLLRLDGGGLQALTQRAGELYRELSRSYAGYLGTPVRMSGNAASMELYKLIFSNFSRLGAAVGAISESAGLDEARSGLETAAARALRELEKAF